MSTTTATDYREKLQQRIADLTKQHTALTEAKATHEKDATHYESVSGPTCEKAEFHKGQPLYVSSLAAGVWDLKCEVENCLSLYDVENQNVSYDLEQAANFISRCIASCYTTAQVNTTEKMIEGLSIVFPETSQLAGWLGTLRLEIYKIRQQLLNGELRSEFR